MQITSELIYGATAHGGRVTACRGAALAMPRLGADILETGFQLARGIARSGCFLQRYSGFTFALEIFFPALSIIFDIC